jgi:hypothetical protein
VKTLAIAIIATVALLSATTVVQADSSGCAPTLEAAHTSEVVCVQGESEETEEEELEYEEVTSEEVTSEEVLAALTASSISSEPASTNAGTRSSSPPTPTTTKLTTCRRASEATIRAEAKHIRKLRGRRRRIAERRLDRALCR